MIKTKSLAAFCQAALKAQPYTMTRKPFLLNEKDFDVLDYADSMEYKAKAFLNMLDGKTSDSVTTDTLAQIKRAMGRRAHARQLYQDYAGGVLQLRLFFLKAEQSAARLLKSTYINESAHLAKIVRDAEPWLDAIKTQVIPSSPAAGPAAR